MGSTLSVVSRLEALSIFGDGQEGGNGVREYVEELVYVQRADGLGLEGAIIRPAGVGVAAKPVCIIWIHGNTSRFYDEPYINVGRELARQGYTFITGNTHGHDVTSVTWGPAGEAAPGGACWERFEETPLDVEAWVNFAEEQGFEGVVLVGHSFGANKAVYYQAERQDSRVLGVVSASGDVRWKAAPERLALAEQMEDSGRAGEVLPALELPWYSMSARTYLGRARLAQHVFTSDERTPYIGLLRCPVLAFYGTGEEWCGTEADLDEIKRNATASPRVDTHMLEGADHVYWGREADAAGLIAAWAGGLLAA